MCVCLSMPPVLPICLVEHVAMIFALPLGVPCVRINGKSEQETRAFGVFVLRLNASCFNFGELQSYIGQGTSVSLTKLQNASGMLLGTEVLPKDPLHFCYSACHSQNIKWTTNSIITLIWLNWRMQQTHTCTNCNYVYLNIQMNMCFRHFHKAQRPPHSHLVSVSFLIINQVKTFWCVHNLRT